jgi:hypothetical protein
MKFGKYGRRRAHPKDVGSATDSLDNFATTKSADV